MLGWKGTSIRLPQQTVIDRCRESIGLQQKLRESLPEMSWESVCLNGYYQSPTLLLLLHSFTHSFIHSLTHSFVRLREFVLVSVTSSEKVDKENRYADFLLSSIPYPGCEFFRDWKDNGYRSEGLVFDWNQVFNCAYLCHYVKSVSCSLWTLLGCSWGVRLSVQCNTIYPRDSETL